jgi:uncharacterized membrane protein
MQGMQPAFVMVCLAACFIIPAVARTASAALYATTDFGTQGGPASGALGINANGPVAGSASTTGNAATHAVPDQADATSDLNTLLNPLSGWTLSVADGVNDQGQIAGYGNIGAQTEGYLVRPVPEPSALALTAVGLLVVAGILCRAGAAIFGFDRRRDRDSSLGPDSTANGKRLRADGHKRLERLQHSPGARPQIDLY